MLHFDIHDNAFVGQNGSLPVTQGDELSRRLALLLEGECQLGPKAAAEKFGLSRQRYFQLRKQYQHAGALALVPQKPGPKQNYRRTGEVVRQVIRHRFLDPEASTEVIAQKLQQTGFEISIRSVERIIQDYALQKKVVSTSAADAAAGRNPTHHDADSTRTR